MISKRESTKDLLLIRMNFILTTENSKKFLYDTIDAIWVIQLLVVTYFLYDYPFENYYPCNMWNF